MNLPSNRVLCDFLSKEVTRKRFRREKVSDGKRFPTGKGFRREKVSDGKRFPTGKGFRHEKVSDTKTFSTQYLCGERWLSESLRFSKILLEVFVLWEML